MRLPASVVLTGLALCSALGEARAETPTTSALAAEAAEVRALTPPALLLEGAPRLHVALPESREARGHTTALAFDLSFQVLRLAVHGDGTPGLSTFLGTSTTTLGGFRLRF